ncbi:MAG: RNase adapter RapZ [Deltaproteobacteria bacterium]|nr:RNase adapter RapZ [Deltaproteobacteria bacterium]
MKVVIITGLSGAGKSTALRALEDLNFFCVDNLPLPLLGKFVELLGGQAEMEKAALVIDAREGEFLGSYREAMEVVRSAGHAMEVLFLDSADDTLLRRFSETRRRHPLGVDDLREGIQRERQLLAPLRDDASAVVDTGNLNAHQLKGIIQARYGRVASTLSVTLLSFGFKHGLPTEADLVLDVRFLANPYFVDTLAAKTGLSEEVARYVLENEDAREFLKKIEDLLTFSLPRFGGEGKAYLTIAIGCTGGRHRSVAVVEDLRKRLSGKWSLTIRHRDLDRGSGGETVRGT